MSETGHIAEEPQSPYDKVFNAEFEQYREHDGKKCRILRELTDEERDPEVGDMYEIELESGEKIEAWPVELEEEYIVFVPEIHYSKYGVTAVTPGRAFRLALDGCTEDYQGLDYANTLDPSEKPWTIMSKSGEETVYQEKPD